MLFSIFTASSPCFAGDACTEFNSDFMITGCDLPGGRSQIFIAAWEQKFAESVEWVADSLATGWKDLDGVGYAAGNLKAAGAARLQRLEQYEDQSKRPAAAGAH